MKRLAWLLPLLLLGACAKDINEGKRIKDLAEERAERPPPVPVARTEQVGPDLDQARQNYEKLLDLPQDPATRAETMRRLADLQLESDEATGGAGGEEVMRRSIALYTGVLAEHPDAPNNDRVLYQLARAYQNVGEIGKAEEALARLTRQFPRSPYTDDARFRRGELLFRLGQFDDAAVEYRHIMSLGEATPFFETAQYKYGWSQYKQSNHDDALKTFFAILNRELPPGAHTDVAAALAGVAPGKKDLAQDALRVISLSFAMLGGGEAATRYFAAHGEPPYVALVYVALGEHLLEKKRYTDSAQAYSAFVDTHQRHELAPSLMGRAIAAYTQGGFADLAVQEKERYARHFDPAAAYWGGRAPPPPVMAELRGHLEDVARHYQARAQKNREDAAQSAAAAADFQAATRAYRRLLELYPQDPEAAELRFLMAEALFESGETVAAAEQYEKVATDFPAHEKAPEAAYAALIARQRHSTEVPAAQKAAAQRKSVEAALTLAERYAQHPQALAALTRAAEDLYQLGDWERAVATAARVLKAAPPAPEALRRTALGVTADARFSQKQWAEAEAAYVELLKIVPADDPGRAALGERLASAIYKQGEAHRAAGDSAAAAEAFLRVGRAVPASPIRATADYDAAAMLIAAGQWSRAAAVLEGFRAANPAHALLPDVDRKLAVAYQNAQRPREAAAVLKRIAARSSETPDARRDAGWLTATLLDQAGDAQAAAAYESYVTQHPQPLEPAMEARHKLAGYAEARKDGTRRLHWLREIVAADAAAGGGRTPRTQLLAAQATLELGRDEARRAGQVALTLPLKSSLPAKKAAIERAIATLTRAAESGIAEVTTAATFELGLLYQEFSRSLLKSARPRGLSALEREQYDLLLEEQAFPFEEKAIQWHEANLQRVPQGTYTPWVGRSLEALAQLAPGRYGKREQTTDLYDGLR
jgi:cellulose synthase operon protein C